MVAARADSATFAAGWRGGAASPGPTAQMTPSAAIASATRMKPAMFAPIT